MAIQMSSELLDGCVLGLLSHDDYYGYALTQKIQESITVSESTMYPVLRRLKKNGLLTTYDQPYQGRNRRYYKITAEGKRQFDMIQQEWQEFKDGVDKMLGDELNE
ncbi:PadR family transcriptional regulator [Lentilactobacillus parafarraginis]|jgi:PadR family transcriptional regulator PadR|uniref:Transcriptional regulator, PadR family n=3 Tax=Lentilactobacillus parafarraginis TaxID=390842 RepID=A0A0R1YTL9_9LACO|nr:PadR family transcriptional regulator [Lentilactobacillus parafarraginis]EHL95416.1 transcriptional regulator, PadR family [Lentilactobacillus parafarraginis F0439]KRM45934.1 transcriptional regulator, PadR family [Lentilactobacillus parafarraginis DSM 18390 = JCM 14109]TLQ19301.1 PadR family transcriptional regulator [Lentilactobacillus parafarraginis]